MLAGRGDVIRHDARGGGPPRRCPRPGCRQEQRGGHPARRSAPSHGQQPADVTAVTGSPGSTVRRRTRNDPARGEGEGGVVTLGQRLTSRQRFAQRSCASVVPGGIERLYSAPAHVAHTQSWGGVDRGEVGETPPRPLIAFRYCRLSAGPSEAGRNSVVPDSPDPRRSRSRHRADRGGIVLIGWSRGCPMSLTTGTPATARTRTTRGSDPAMDAASHRRPPTGRTSRSAEAFSMLMRRRSSEVDDAELRDARNVVDGLWAMVQTALGGSDGHRHNRLWGRCTDGGPRPYRIIMSTESMAHLWRRRRGTCCNASMPPRIASWLRSP